MAFHRLKPLAIVAVASLLAMDRTTVTASLKPLEPRGLVKTQSDPADRRSRLSTLTPRDADCLRAPCQSGESLTARLKIPFRTAIPAGCEKRLTRSLLIHL
jgi:DNA-binding MarR family transcriptional regulator